MSSPKKLKTDMPVNMVNIKYEWKFDKAVRANFRMEGDGVRSSVIQLGGGHAVRVHAALEPKIPKFCNQALLFLAIFGEPGGQQRAAFRGRWMVTLGIAETGESVGKPITETQILTINKGSLHRDRDFTLYFDFTIEAHTEEQSPPKAPGPKLLSQKMWGLLTRGEMTDVVLVASDGRELSAHRAILGGHSQVFLAMFTHQTVEQAQGRVNIPDADSKVLAEMLKWMYTAGTPDLADPLVARGLLLVADKYQLDELKAYCECAFPVSSVETVCSLLQLAELHGAAVLKGRVMASIQANMAEVKKTEGWRDLLRAKPELVADLVTGDCRIIIHPNK